MDVPSGKRSGKRLHNELERSTILQLGKSPVSWTSTIKDFAVKPWATNLGRFQPLPGQALHVWNDDSLFQHGYEQCCFWFVDLLYMMLV